MSERTIRRTMVAPFTTQDRRASIHAGPSMQYDKTQAVVGGGISRQVLAIYAADCEGKAGP